MFNHPLELTKTKYSRLLIKKNNTNQNRIQPQQLSQKQQSPIKKNIFSVDKDKILKELNDISFKQQKIINPYQVCGDIGFKIKYLSERNSIEKSYHNQSNTNTNHIKLNLNSTLDNFHLQQSFNPQRNTQTSKFNSKKKMSQTIYLDQTQRKTFLSTLNPIQINKITREKKNIQRFKQTQQKWYKIQTHLKYRLPKAQTATFSSVKTMYVHQNPVKLDVINDMLPNYWRNSLRNNDKKLKSHLRGHKFKHQIAQQMLQTLKGTKRIQQSIPKIGQFHQNHNESQNNFYQNKIKLKGKKIEKHNQLQTMRDFHKQVLQNLNQSVSKRVHSLDRKKGNRSQLTISNKTIDNSNINLLDLQDLTDQMTQQQRRTYKFCNGLQKLDRIDNQLYMKQYDKNKIWIHEGYQIQG